MEGAEFPDDPAVAMSGNSKSIRDELFGYAPADPIVRSTLESAWGLVAESEAAASLDELHLCVLNPAVATPELKASRYFTESCQALSDEKVIVVNEEFLLELETAIRSFEQSDSLLGCPFLKSDAQMFGLIQRIRSGPGRYRDRLRRQTQRETADAAAEPTLRHALTLVTLFFLGHELGHFVGGHPAGQFATFVDPDSPLEEQIEGAVVKLCRHVDEFAPTQFGLPGFERVADPSSDVRQVAGKYRAQDERRYERQEAFFANEADADNWANRTVIAHLEAIAKRDEVEAERALYILSKGLFVSALYTWYRDLEVFGRKLDFEAINDSRIIGLALVRGREQYIHASSLFGELHRFTLLRAALALEVIMRARTTWFELPRDARSIWCAHGAEAVAADPAIRREWWLAESLQRYFLLCISMDMAVKIANVGCMTGWLKDADTRRDSPQLLFMEFESIDQAVKRLQRIP
jgi:hypothetical protein